MKPQAPQFKAAVLFLTLSLSLIGYQRSERYEGSVLELKEELSIGTDDGTEEYWFNDIADIDADSKGNIYVADHRDSRIKIYNAEGKFLKTIGRKGQGPGDFQALWKIFIDRNDYLYTSDVTLRKLSVFNPGGKYVASYAFPNIGYSVRDFYVDKNGNFLLIESSLERSEKERKTISEINLYSKDLKLIRNIFTCESFSWDVASINNRRISVRKPYPLILRCSFIRDGKIVFGRNDKYEFYIHSLDKNTTEKFIGEYEPLKVTKKDKDEFLEFYRQISNKEPYAKDFIKATSFPEIKPPFYNIIADDTGYIIFVTFEQNENKGTGCDIYDFNGNFVKKVFIKGIPELNSMNVRLDLKFRNNNIYASLYTEEGFPKAVRYRLLSVK